MMGPPTSRIPAWDLTPFIPAAFLLVMSCMIALALVAALVTASGAKAEEANDTDPGASSEMTAVKARLETPVSSLFPPRDIMLTARSSLSGKSGEVVMPRASTMAGRLVRVSAPGRALLRYCIDEVTGPIGQGLLRRDARPGSCAGELEIEAASAAGGFPVFTLRVGTEVIVYLAADRLSLHETRGVGR